ncbi:MFS transporter [Granulicella sp. L60]|uniref:MFS transporter n=1 Tax=Granulicella sp. L60 TaxID=1641866 RepID=UPI00131D5BBB|nr:MFS transporter [Granulicella sp. L60]
MNELSQERDIETNIPERMDQLPWSRWHVRIITALGTSWLLDGLEVTLVGSLSGILESKNGLSLTNPQVTAAATVYLAGAVCGALFFGHLTDRLGRKKLFLVTLATYSVATICTALSMNFLFFAFCRFFTGLGIGGEYAAINSAVDELIPGKVRGTVDLFVNATFWVGATVGSIAAFILLGGHGLPLDRSWRYAFGIGGALGLGVLLLRLKVPESPRWLMLRGKEEDADRVVDSIEAEVKKSGKQIIAPTAEKLKLRTRDHTPLKEIFANMLGENRARSFLGLALMVGQSFFFNAVFFTYALIGKRFYHLSDEKLPLQLLPFAVASFLGPVLLGRLFDTVGRKPMITATYGIAGLMLAVVCYPFAHGMIGLKGLGICFTLIFFVASSAASAAYLTVSEIFPLEMRAFAIAVFYAIGTLIGGVGAPLLFGELIATGSKAHVAEGWALGAILMIFAATMEGWIGVEAAGQSLESVSKPLQSR